MKTNSPVYFLSAILISFLLSCSSPVREKEMWEGINDSMLRVFIYYEYPADYDGRINHSLKELLMDTGRSRAAMILMNYIRLHVSGIDRAAACQHAIAGIVARGTMRHVACDIQHCTAQIDYDVSDFLKTACIPLHQ